MNASEIKKNQEIETNIALIILDNIFVSGKIFYENREKYLIGGEFQAAQKIMELFDLPTVDK